MGHGRRQLMRLIKSDPSWVEPLRRGEVDLEPVGMATLAIALTAAYGLAMAAFAAAKAQEAWATQLLASALKVPVLTILTFAATYPAFVLANRLGGLRLRPRAVLRLCLATFAVYAASLGALAPAIALCSVVCNYSFTILINVAFFAASGLAAAAYLLRWVGDLSQAPDAARSPVAGPGGRPLRPRVAFAAWVVVFGLVGSQLGWMMRPLVGWRTLPFSWFRTDGMTLWEGIGSEIQNIWYSGGV